MTTAGESVQPGELEKRKIGPRETAVTNRPHTRGVRENLEQCAFKRGSRCC